ncbi:MAG TPA: glycosyltransferase family 2 protein [Gemmatimonadales bacterium]|nr:glycosyltransferase family 2 protein [Gemmatimonadales bacterium]
MTWAIPAAYALLLLLLVYRYVTRRPRLSAYAPQISGPLVSVIIPARDEAVNIEACVRSALATAYEAVEVIVVDDRSTDGTPEVVERLAADTEGRGRAHLVRGGELPEGWFGKQWAMVQGYRAARGELLLFMDADTWQHPELLPRAVRALEVERVDLLSALSRQEMVSFWERLVQPHVFFALAARVGDLRRVNRTRVEWDAVASGQFILTTRAAYEAVGTHEAVKKSVVDDMALAQTFTRHHLDIFLTHAEEYMTTRMYRSLAGILEGWTKNLATGVPLAFPPIPLLRRLAPYVMWLPAFVWIAPPVLWAIYGWAWAAWTTAISLVIWLMVYQVSGAPLRYALLYPLGAATVAYIMIRSALRGSRRIEWRGRSYHSD